MKKQTGTYRTYKDMLKDLPKIGRLQIISFAGKNKWGNTIFNCKCDCGTELQILFCSLNKEHTQSCGCLQKEIVKKTGDANRKFFFNKDKLKLNNTTSYILGLFAADGWISGDKCVGITLQDTDKDIIFKIKDYFEYDGNIRYRKKSIDSKSYNHKDIYGIDFTDKELMYFFRENGIISQKTINYKVPEHFKNNKHFWRGMIDGDGCVYHYKLKDKDGYDYYTYGITLIGTHDLISNFVLYTESLISKKIGAGIRKAYGCKIDVFTIHITGKSAVIVLNEIYSELSDNFYLKRKYEKYQEILKIHNRIRNFTPMKGKTHSKNTKKIISERNSIKILQFDLEGNFIREWPSISSAAIELGLKIANINCNLRNRSKTAYKFIWKYKI